MNCCTLNIVLNIDTSGELTDFDILPGELFGSTRADLEKAFDCHTCRSSHIVRVFQSSTPAPDPPQTQTTPQLTNVFSLAGQASLQISEPYHLDDEQEEERKPSKPELIERKVSANDIKPTCGICGKIFAFKTSVFRHLRIAHQNFRYNCQMCPRRFTRTEDLTDHIDSEHKNIRYPCRLCDKVLRTKKYLQLHVIKFHPTMVGTADEGIKSEQTSNSFLKEEENETSGMADDEESDMNQTEINVDDDLQLNNFHPLSMLPLHFQMDSGDDSDNPLLQLPLPPLPPPPLPPQRSEELIVSPMLEQLLETPLSEIALAKPPPQLDLMICFACKKRFNTIADLKRHSGTHEEMKNTCPICFKTFAFRSGYFRHIRIQHERKPSVTCPHCDVNMKRTIDLQNHCQRVHFKGGIVQRFKITVKNEMATQLQRQKTQQFKLQLQHQRQKLQKRQLQRPIKPLPLQQALPLPPPPLVAMKVKYEEQPAAEQDVIMIDDDD